MKDKNLSFNLQVLFIEFYHSENHELQNNISQSRAVDRFFGMK